MKVLDRLPNPFCKNCTDYWNLPVYCVFHCICAALFNGFVFVRRDRSGTWRDCGISCRIKLDSSCDCGNFCECHAGVRASQALSRFQRHGLVDFVGVHF